MQTLSVLAVIALMTWGAIALGETVTKTLQARRATAEPEPVNYDGVLDAVGNGLSGVDCSTEQSGHVVGGLLGRLLEHLGHFLHR